ncbi:helix-turn-helix domain-containing protein [Methylobacterium radiotolerans]|uniref:DNA binding domain-containing protein, excisionase family n=1 Tax=Microbacterium paraoxydans TaxID=199592 RepID=A0A1H1M8H3_9MICO|nr:MULTISPECIES: helix-turn-helix domain-containing protein [Microbacterium]MCK2031757.1 helix-turn-helix domain-containing protein [Microbacterium sp. KSW4-4]PJI55854.1 helix-turn-helix domain-containing protein [Methylobacterium radiotolerans]SDR83093.1 DNA binding domain-containing protein, excisionase family [Microbacterium paraoxydans]
MPTDALAPRWGTIDDGANEFKVSPDTIRRMITRGEIEAKRFGPRLIRVNLASIEAAGRPLQYLGGDAA